MGKTMARGKPLVINMGYLAELLSKKDAIDPLNITYCCQAYWFPPISEDTTYVISWRHQYSTQLEATSLTH